jgi:hypothetical protein
MFIAEIAGRATRNQRAPEMRDTESLGIPAATCAVARCAQQEQTVVSSNARGEAPPKAVASSALLDDKGD